MDEFPSIVRNPRADKGRTTIHGGQLPPDAAASLRKISKMAPPIVTITRFPAWFRYPATALLLGAITGAILFAMLPTVTICKSSALHGNIGNHLRSMVTNVLDIHRAGKPWPTSMAEYQDQCRQAGLEDSLPRLRWVVFVAWEQFPRAAAERQTLPACVVMAGEFAVVGFTDGHYESTRKASFPASPTLSTAGPARAAP